MQEKPKLCKDCKHFEMSRNIDKCKAMGPEQVDVVYGWEDLPSCYFMRGRESKCGQSGKLFEQKVAWYKFW